MNGGATVYPDISLVIDPARDIENHRLFRAYSNEEMVRKFLPDALESILDPSVGEEEGMRVVEAFVTESFKRDAEFIERHVDNVCGAWHGVRTDYFKLVDGIFSMPWPKGQYIGYASVFLMYPRNIDEKTFYFSAYPDRGFPALPTIAHELLHFMFYEYIEKRYDITEESCLLGKPTEYVWYVSEVFNLVIETWPPYQRLFGTSGNPYHTEHARMYPEMADRWKKSPSVETLLDQYFVAR